ncbi:MAG: hypothetical protein AAF449_09550, partial [Myxococcota bacterium]
MGEQKRQWDGASEVGESDPPTETYVEQPSSESDSTPDAPSSDPEPTAREEDYLRPHLPRDVFGSQIGRAPGAPPRAADDDQDMSPPTDPDPDPPTAVPDSGASSEIESAIAQLQEASGPLDRSTDDFESMDGPASSRSTPARAETPLTVDHRVAPPSSHWPDDIQEAELIDARPPEHRERTRHSSDHRDLALPSFDSQAPDRSRDARALPTPPLADPEEWTEWIPSSDFDAAATDDGGTRIEAA